ncbi:DUF3180 domain-containing protein [Actinomycetaceae bacterium L2_0104]
MRTVTWWLLVGWLAGGVILGSGITMFLLRNGREPPPFPAATALVLVIALAVLLWWGWQIRRFKARKSSLISAASASRIAALALASSYSGALLAGMFSMMAVVYWMNGSTEYIREQVTVLGLAALSSLALTIGGLVVERWCRLDDSDDAVQSPGARP